MKLKNMSQNQLLSLLLLNQKASILRPRNLKKTVWIIAGVIFVGICICLILCIAVLASGTGSVVKEQKPIMSVLDTFMREMEAKNGENAYSLFSPRAQKQTPLQI